MSLKLLQPGVQPLGQFDGLDTEFLTLKGGEVVTFTSISSEAGVDKAAKDVFDGYVNPSLVKKRVVVTKTLTTGKRPLMLADDGITGYGTLFGVVVGGTVGQVSTGGAVLGPHTAIGSGKVTLWEKPGLYAVSLDACDTDATTGLQPTNSGLNTGDKLYATAAGLLTPNHSIQFEDVVVGRFVSFETNGSLVTTPNNLVAALNPPDGTLASAFAKQFTFATFYFNPPAA